MVRHAVAFQGFRNCRDLLPRCATREFCNFRGCRFPFQEGFQHELTGSSEEIRQYAAQFDIGVLQNLLDTIPLAAAVRENTLAAARQISKLSNRARWDEAWTDHVMPQQIC